VADLQKDPDDKWESAIVDAVENLEDVVGGNEGAGQGATAKTGIEVIRIPRTISTSGNKTGVAETRAFEEAQRYLEKSRADLVIWGSVVEVGEKSGPRVFWTTTTATKRSSNLLNSTDLELPADFWSQLATMLQLVVVTQYAQVSSQEGHYVADTLAPFIKKVRELIPQTHGAGWTDQSRFQIKSLLAESLMIYGEQAGDNAALEEAIGYYQELAQLYPRERAPLDWASNQNNLGVAMGQLGEHELDASDLRLAVAAFRAALLEYTRDSVPLNWAMTENNLGNTLGELAERDQDPKQFCEAVEAHSAAWQIFQQTAPYDASIAVDGVKEDLRLIAKQSRPDLYATCLDNQRAVLKDMGLDTAEK
jgi:tetratricopeptide (TPR) repeat protein